MQRLIFRFGIFLLAFAAGFAAQQTVRLVTDVIIDICGAFLVRGVD